MMLKELKRKSFKKIIPLLLFALAFGIAPLYGSDFGIVKLIGGGKQLDELPPDQIEGKYVTYTVDFLYGTYAYTTETSKSSSRPVTVSSEYVIPVGYEGGQFMGLFAGKSYIPDFDRLSADSAAYIDGEKGQPAETYTVTGTVMPMDSERIRYFHEAVGYDDGDAEYQAMFQPYYLKVGYLGNATFGITIAVSVLSALSLLSFVIILVHGISGHYQKDLKKIAEKAGLSMDWLESWFVNTKDINGLRLGDDWVMFNDGAYTRLLRPSDIAWAYQQTTTHRTNGFKTGTSYGLIIRLANENKMFTLPMRTETAVFAVLETMGQKFSDIVRGYSKERECRYNSDPAGFVRTELERIRTLSPELY